MFQNLTRSITGTTDALLDTLDLLKINVTSLKAISEGGNIKAEDFKAACIADAALAADKRKYDITKQRIDLDANMQALLATPKPKK